MPSKTMEDAVQREQEKRAAAKKPAAKRRTPAKAKAPRSKGNAAPPKPSTKPSKDDWEAMTPDEKAAELKRQEDERAQGAGFDSEAQRAGVARIAEGLAADAAASTPEKGHLAVATSTNKVFGVTEGDTAVVQKVLFRNGEHHLILQRADLTEFEAPMALFDRLVPKAEEAPKPKPKAKAKGKPKGDRKPSMRTEAEEVLRASDAPLHVKAVIAAVLERGNIETKGKTPEASLSSIMLRHPNFTKTAPGTFCLTPKEA